VSNAYCIKIAASSSAEIQISSGVAALGARSLSPVSASTGGFSNHCALTQLYAVWTGAMATKGSVFTEQRGQPNPFQAWQSQR